jgi:hypothetical protein
METSGQLWAERSHAREHAAAAERARIAREMHDVVGALAHGDGRVGGATATEDGARARGDGPDPIRVVIADDQQLIRLGFGLVLDAEADIAGVGEAVDGADAVAMCARSDRTSC